MGQIWASYYILGCCLLLFHSPGSCDTVRQLEAPQNGFQPVTFGVPDFANFGKQKLLKAAEDSLRVGRGISSINPVHILSTLPSGQSKELDDIQRKYVTPRRFLAENTTRFDTREALGNTLRRKKKVAGAKKEKRKVGQRDKKDQKVKRFQGAKAKEEKRGKDPDEAQALVKQQLDQSKIGLASSSVDIGEQVHPNAAISEGKQGAQGTEKESRRNDMRAEIVKENSALKSIQSDDKGVEDGISVSKSIQDTEKEGEDENSVSESIQDIEKDESSVSKSRQENEKEVKDGNLVSKSIQENEKEVKDASSESKSIRDNDNEVKDENSVSKSAQDNVKKENDENLELAEEIVSPDESEFSTQNNTLDEEGNSRVHQNQETPDLNADQVELNQTISDRQGKWVNGTGQESEIPNPEVNNADESTGNATNESKPPSIDKQPSSVNLEETTENSTAAAEGMEDEYSDFIQEVADLPSKLQDTAGKVAERLRPELEKISNTSKNYFNQANEGITQGFRPLIGNKYAPFLASVVSYIFVLLPLVVVVVLFGQVRTYFPLQKVILYINIYLAAYFATLMIASFLIGMEPMGFFYRNSLSGYIYLQLLEALGYIVYLFLQCLNLIICCSNGPTTAKFAALLQCAVSMFIGLHSYVTAFHRAMAQKAPRTTWKTHGIYAFAFFTLCLFAKVKQGKKEYIQEGNGINTNKKN